MSRRRAIEGCVEYIQETKWDIRTRRQNQLLGGRIETFTIMGVRSKHLIFGRMQYNRPRKDHNSL